MFRAVLMLSVPQISLYLWPNFTDPLKGTLPAASQVAFLLPNPILYLDNPDFLAVWNKRKRNWSVLWMNKLPGDLFSEKHVFHINPWKKKVIKLFFFLATASYSRQSHICYQDEVFPVLLIVCFRVSYLMKFTVDTHFSFLLLWFLAYSH